MGRIVSRTEKAEQGVVAINILRAETLPHPLGSQEKAQREKKTQNKRIKASG